MTQSKKVVFRGADLDIQKGSDGKIWIRDMGDSDSNKIVWLENAERLYIGGEWSHDEERLIVTKAFYECDKMEVIE